MILARSEETGQVTFVLSPKSIRIGLIILGCLGVTGAVLQTLAQDTVRVIISIPSKKELADTARVLRIEQDNKIEIATKKIEIKIDDRFNELNETLKRFEKIMVKSDEKFKKAAVSIDREDEDGRLLRGFIYNNR